MMKKEECPAAGANRPLGLYIHIPFCIRKCLYCDFLSGPASKERIDQYVLALGDQIEAEAKSYGAYEVQTVFFGGGTPSLLTADQIGALLERIRACYRLCEEPEITMESNPGTLDAGRLRGYRSVGINRLSMGLQSADDIELKRLGRIHTYADFLANFAAAREAGFSNINVDLMFAIPGQREKNWEDTLTKVAGLGPEHISAYSLIVEEGTPFCRMYGEKETVPEEEERLMYVRTGQLLEQYGYKRYEISNYAKPGCACRHNIGYWRRTEYAGFGLGSASLVDNVRWRVTDDMERYLACAAPKNGDAGGGGTKEDAAEKRDAMKSSAVKVNAGKCGEGRADAPKNGAKGVAAIRDHREAYEGNRPDWREEMHALSTEEQMEEFLFLGLRMTEGIRLSDFRRQFGSGLRDVYGPVLEKLEEQGLLIFYEDGKKMRLTDRGTDISNYVLAQFLLDTAE